MTLGGGEKKKMEGVSLLPLAAVVCSLGTIATSCGLATHYNHVPAYPQISMYVISPLRLCRSPL